MRTVFYGICTVALPAAMPAAAQFTGPGVEGAAMPFADAASARTGSYVTVEGTIVAHLREDYYTFRDASGDIRIEIEPGVFANRPVGADTPVRLLGEVDTGPAGRYLWVKTLDILP